MLNSETKRHIDSARQVLVGKVPNPMSQIQEITNALIYKFMDDMDERVARIGGKRRYFTGEYEKYSWRKIMDPKVGSHERYELYTEALKKLSLSPNLPEIFRNIFKDAYLPYNDGRTLSLFLQEIEYFDYKHSEELGNAYEYLLSIMGSQGDAGQFRTPRHIIDFIVAVADPEKRETVLDPACGTAGFLISAFKHIIAKHDGKDDKTGKPTKKEKPLSSDEQDRLYNNFLGFDIDDNMVKMSQVNLYLHGFKNPKVLSHDTLSSEDYWTDRYDVILANPPFMSPKGGIEPHNKFEVRSTRSEVLFVDYIMNHLKPSGRAGIIVPEGIIFQSGSAHKQLRKNLIEDGLFAVVSLPSGVFNPYAGVKTSILLFDNNIAKKTDEVLFIKVEKDGYDLGANRRPLCNEKGDQPEWCPKHSDLPQALDTLNRWKVGDKVENKLSVYVEKSKIAENSDYNLSGDRYRLVTDYTDAKWPMIAIEDLCDLGRGRVISKKDIELNPGPFPVFSSQTTDNGTFGYLGTYDFDGEYVTWTTDGANAGTVFYRSGKFNCTNVCGTLKAKSTNVNMHFLAKALNAVAFKYVMQVGNPKLMNGVVAKIKIPLPPLEIQEQIVAELDGYAGIVVGAKQIVQNWEPKIDIEPEWEKVKFGDVCELGRGFAFKSDDYTSEGVLNFRVTNIGNDGQPDLANSKYLPAPFLKSYRQYELHEGDFVIVMVGATSGKIGYITKDILPALLNQNMWRFLPNKSKIDQNFLYYLVQSFDVVSQGGAQGYLTQSEFIKREIPLPSLAIQKKIVEKIEAERAIVDANKQLIKIYDRKIKDAIGKLWEQA